MVLVEDVLTAVGLDEKEAKLYVAVLKKGDLSATALSRETMVERTLVYYILERLINKGLISFKLKNNVKYYSASDPKNILDSLKEKVKMYSEVLPTLSKLKSDSGEEELHVDVFKGFEGSKAVLKEILKGTKEILVLGEQGQLQKEYPEYNNVYFHALRKQGIHERVIAREDLRGKIAGWEKSTFRYLPKSSLSPTTTVIAGHKILITLWDKPLFHILISSRKVSDSYRTYFEQVWKGAKR